MKFRIVLLIVCILTAFSCNRNPETVKRKYLENGNKYFENGKFKEASILYRKALSKDMRFGEAYYRLALAEMKLGRYSDAIRALRRSVELQPDNAEAHSMLAGLFLTIYISDRSRPEALLKEVRELSDTLLTRNPRSFDGLRIKGQIAMLENKPKEAVEVLRQANEIKQMQPDLVILLVQALGAADQSDEAERLAKALLEKHKNYGPMYDYLYALHAKRGQRELAEAALKSKVENNPKQADYRLQLAAHFLISGRPDDMKATLAKLTDNPQDFPDGRMNVGDFYARIRQPERALEHYEAGLKANPGSKLEFQKKIVEMLAALGKAKEALELAESMHQEHPKDASVLAMRGALMLQSGDPARIQAALNDLQAVVGQMPNNPVVRANLGRALAAKGDIAQALIQFEEAIKLRPDYLPAKFAIARLHLTEKDYQKALEQTADILKFAPNNVPARLLRTSALVAVGDRKQARADLNQILKAIPDTPDGILQLAMLDFEEGHTKAAEVGFRKLYQRTPPDPRGLLGMVDSIAAQGRVQEAQMLLDAEIRKAPGSAILRNAAANVAVRAGDYERAVAEYKSILANAPNAIDVHLRLAEALRRKGDSEEAVASLQNAIKQAPNDSRAYLQLAVLYETVHKSGEAKPLYEQILKIVPEHPIALNNLAYLMAEDGGSLDEALTMAQKAKQMLPQDPNVADTLGWIYIKKNLSDEAVGIFRDLVRRDPAHVTWRFHLAMALAQKGNKPEALRELQTALRNKPTKAEESKIKDLIARIG